LRAIEAVLAPAQTDYLYFFARGGKHTFTRTFAEHRQAIDGGMQTR
jgi:cell division protein YceG involved in septum cleavage